MSIEIQIKAKNKAFKVIQSCLTLKQLGTAHKYVERYNILFSDLIGYGELSRLILKKEEKWLKK